MKSVVIGGGPGGLYFSILLKKLDPGRDVTVYERNAADDTFGFGVVFSDETLSGFEAADPPSFDAITRHFARWEDIDIHYRGRVLSSGGHGFSAITRVTLLGILQERAENLGVKIHYRTLAPPPDQLDDADLVLAADGANSAVRNRYFDVFRPSLDVRHCKYMWLGTPLVFEAFTFSVVETPYGVFQVHGYPYSDRMSSFIVETDEATWRRAGLDRSEHHDFRPGESDHEGLAFCERLFAGILDGHPLVANNSRWTNFVTVTNERWHHRTTSGDIVLLGDAAHTAHFSIGSGTKLAMEDAIALAWQLQEHGSEVPGKRESAIEAYEQERRPIVASTQRAAQASLEWFEGIARYVDQDPLQFGFNLLTRSRRITYDELAKRDPGYVETVDAWFAGELVRGGHDRGRPAPRPPMFMPFRLRDLTLTNRVMVSAMDMYSAVDGTPGDFHFVHLGSRAIGGAGTVMTEMVCVSPEGRITPGCAGMYAPEHADAWRRTVEFVHANSEAAIGLQLGHSGRKGSTKLMWEGIDEPLPDGNWPVMAPSPAPYLPGLSQVPTEMAREDMDVVRDQFVASARMGAGCGFDLLELHMGHGYLLSSFLTPVANERADDYGGTLENRARFPLEVFDAVRAVWPDGRPMSVRLSATDWVAGGFDGDDAVAFASMLKEHGCDIVDVSTGQTTPDARPAYGRSYQTPFADRIRNEAGVPTIAVGAISSPDDVNQIILSGRADICALARPHLFDPYWTLHAAADYGYDGMRWPDQYLTGRRKPVTGKDAAGKAPPRYFDPADVPPPGWRGWSARWRPGRGPEVPASG
ncbi:MAG: bifunctional salicylyl-CoA 5-hydroxylase/oxidoreductase [Carbonactinosporaceae bacterium]